MLPLVFCKEKEEKAFTIVRLIFFDVEEALMSDIIENLDKAEKQERVVADAQTTSRAEFYGQYNFAGYFNSEF